MPDHEIMEILNTLYRQAQAQFGAAIKGRWFYDRDGCPGCGKKIGVTKWKGQDTLSLNAFIFREHGVLIGYMLCGKCGKKVMNSTETTPLHYKIEESLKKAFLRHLGH